MQHLVRRRGYYYFRVCVPVDMQGVLRMKEIKKSLHTKHMTHAKVLAKTYDYQLSRIFTLARSGMLDEKQIAALVEEFRNRSFRNSKMTGYRE